MFCSSFAMSGGQSTGVVNQDNNYNNGISPVNRSEQRSQEQSFCYVEVKPGNIAAPETDSAH